MNRNKELAKNTAIITIGKMSTQFLNFFLLPLYTTILSTEEYGLVDLFVTYTSLLMPIVLFQVDQAVFRFLIDERQNEQGQRRVLSTSIGFAALQSLVVIVLFCLVQPFISIQHKWFLLLNILASVTSNMMSQVARGMGDNVTFALGSFASATTQIILNIVLLVVIKMGVTGMLVATVLGHLGCTFVVLIRDKVYKYVSSKEFDRNTLVNILKYAFPLIPNALCWWVLNASDRTIVLFFLGTAANGLLSIGHKFSTVYITIYNIFNLSWTESASLHMNDKDRDVFFTDVINQMFQLFMCVGIGIIACMPFAFSILVNEKFSAAYGIIPVFMLASMLNVVVGLYSVIYVALKKTKEIAKTSIYSGIINIVVHLVLVKFVGLYAAAISSTVAFAIMAVYRYIDLKKYIDVPLNKKKTFLCVLLMVITCAIYYSRSVILQILDLLVVAAVSVVLNKKIINAIVKGILGKILHS